MLHCCIEGERVGDNGDEVVGVDHRHDDGPDGVPVPLRERGESPPPSSSSMNPLDGRRVSPLVLGLLGGRWERAPPRLDLSLCVSFGFSLFLPSRFWHFTISYIPGDP